MHPNIFIASLFVAVGIASTAQAQVPLRRDHQTWPAIQPQSPIQRMLSEASPSDRVSARDASHQTARNPATVPRSASVSRATTPEPQNTELPIVANMNFDDQDGSAEYLKKYEARKLIQERAQRERELRLLRMETRKFYGISLSRPMGSPMMFGGMYAPNWIGGWNTAYGLRGQYPRQQLYFQYR